MRRSIWASFGLIVLLIGCTSVERQAYNVVVGAKAFLDSERSAHPECATGATTTVCTDISKAVLAKDALISAIEVYCAGPTFNASGDQGACNPPAKGTPAATQATAKLQAAIANYNQVATELKGVAK